VPLKPDAGKGFYDQFELVTPDGLFQGGTMVAAEKQAVADGLSWGLYVRDGRGSALYVLAEGAEVRLLEVAKPSVVVDRWRGDGDVVRLAIVSHYAFGLTVLVDGQPRWTVAMGTGRVGAAMVRRPKLLDDDEATLEMTIDRADPADEASVAKALREKSSVF